MECTFHFDRESIFPGGIKVELLTIPRKGESIKFGGTLGEEIEKWEEERDDCAVVGFVEHRISAEKIHTIHVVIMMRQHL